MGEIIGVTREAIRVTSIAPQERLCHYCGLRPAGSREHLPGTSALNDKPVRVSYLKVGSPGRGLTTVTRVERDGFVVHTICKRCNERTGGSYGTAFKDFALQFVETGSLYAGNNRAWISLHNIQPLRVLKQIAAMFLAAQSEFPLPRWQVLADFVRQRDLELATGSPRFYVYRNVGPLGRVSSLAGLGFLGAPPNPLVFSEISWPPLGLVCSAYDHPLVQGMKEITDWGGYSFKARASFGFSVPQYHVEANWPLAFGRRAEADAWIERSHAMLFVIGDIDGDTPTQLSAVLQPHRR